LYNVFLGNKNYFVTKIVIRFEMQDSIIGIKHRYNTVVLFVVELFIHMNYVVSVITELSLMKVMSDKKYHLGHRV